VSVWRWMRRAAKLCAPSTLGCASNHESGVSVLDWTLAGCFALTLVSADFVAWDAFHMPTLEAGCRRG
jgi:hypothetical protein